jgi:DNA-binding HxlR family transcriptional regulator
MNNAQNDTSPTNDYHNQLKMFGDGWMLIIITELLDGTCRFNELQRKVCGISPVTLTNRLKKLEQLGIVTRTVKAEDQLSVSYCVTEKGTAMQPVLKELRAYLGANFANLGDCDKVCEAEE